MVDKQRITVLVQQFADGNISREEYAELIGYFNLTGNEKDIKDKIYAAMDEVWKNTHADETYTQEEAELFYQQLVGSQAFKSHAPKRMIKLWYRYAAAAVVLMALGAGFYFYNTTALAPASVRFAAQDIAPGKNRAILTLSNGKKVALAATGTYNVTAAGAETTDTEFNTITTPRGGQYQINLSDGSSVWLNASSSLTFPVRFAKAERKVVLNGEAYFEIAKVVVSKEHLPFIVKTTQQTVQVLGTHFNIKSYAEDVATTTLLEGSVRVSSSQEEVTLQPGQQAIQLPGKIQVQQADFEEAMAWKNGLFMFSGQDLESIMKQVSRWYNVDVAFENEAIKRQAFKGSISRFKNISQLLEVLESTGSVHFKMEGRRITAMQ